MQISLSGLKEGNPLDCLKLCYQLSPEKFKSAFAKVGIQIIDEKDLDTLNKIIANKVDVEGQLKDVNGNPIMFDTMRICDSIEFTPEEKSKSETFNYIS